ncbi:MAG: EFR1 family ferrodoxin [Clostridiales bacterium]
MNIIYCYSGTGNSKKVSDEISDKLKDCKMYSFFQNEIQYLSSCKTLGFVFSIHSLGLPRLVIKSIERMDFTNIDYIYAVATMGGSYGIAFEQLNNILVKKGSKLSASFALALGSNSNIFMKIPGTSRILSEDEQENKWSKVESEINDIVNKIKMKKVNNLKPISFIFKLISKIAHKAFIKRLPNFDKEFHTKNCNRCEVCKNNCPVNNIRIKDEGPKWLGKCEGCLRCFNICPNESVMYGKMDNPQMYQRYQTNLNRVKKI